MTTFDKREEGFEKKFAVDEELKFKAEARRNKLFGLWVANKLGLEPIQVLEVVTFYPGFRQSAPGKFHIRVCRTLSCAMAGSYELMDSLCKAANIDRSHSDHHHPIAVSPDGKYSIEFAECLASCGTGPVCMVEDDFHEAVKPEKAADLLQQYR